MVAPLQSNCSNRKGIYRDLYREIDSDNKKKDASKARKPRKGIYVEFYEQIEFKNNECNNNQNNLYGLAFKKLINDITSKASYFFSCVAGEARMLILALIVAKKPINSYIENNLGTYSSQGIYYND